MYKFFFLLTFFTFGYSKTYTLYLASTKYLDVAKDYYYDIKFHAPDFYDVIIRTHKKENYSVIIRNIPDIDKTKKVQKLLLAAGKYKDSYIKVYEEEPIYNIIKLDKNVVLSKEKIKPYKQEVENSNEYISASIMYNTKQYQKAYDLFYKLFLENNYNKNINFFFSKKCF